MQAEHTKSKSSAPDLRSRDQRALEEATEWLLVKMPDRRPATWDVLFANRSHASGLAVELAHRLFNEHRLHTLYPRMRHPLDKLPKLLLQFELPEREIRAAITAVDDTLHEIANPPPIPAPSPSDVAIAKALGIKTLPADASRARELIVADMMQRWSGDRRAAVWFHTLVAEIANGSSDSILARRAVRLLEGFLLPTGTSTVPANELWPGLFEVLDETWNDLNVDGKSTAFDSLAHDLLFALDGSPACLDSLKRVLTFLWSSASEAARLECTSVALKAHAIHARHCACCRHGYTPAVKEAA